MQFLRPVFPHPTVSDLNQGHEVRFVPRPDLPVVQRFEPFSGSGQFGAWIATPGFLKDEMDRINGEIRSTGRDIQDRWVTLCEVPGTPFIRDDSPCGRLQRFVTNSWSPFVIEWDQFRGRHGAFFSRLWGNLWDQLQAYRKRLIGLRAAAEQLQVEMTGPAPQLPPQQDFEKLATNVWTFIKTVSYVGLGIGVGWLGLQIVREVRGPRQGLAGSRARRSRR